MRRRGIRLRMSQKLRTTRVKECTILPCLDEGMISDDPYTCRRAIAMCMHLKNQVGLHFMGYSVLRGLVACRRRLKYLLDLIDEPDNKENFSIAPATKPWPLHDEFLENMKEIPPIRSKDWYKFTLRQLNILKQRIGIRPEEWEQKLGPTPLKKVPSFLAVCWSEYAKTLNQKRLKDLAEQHDERIMKLSSTSRSVGSEEEKNSIADDNISLHKFSTDDDDDEFDDDHEGKGGEDGKDEENKTMVILTKEQISQASEEEICTANRMVFGPNIEYLNGALIRINVHKGPTDRKYTFFTCQFTLILHTMLWKCTYDILTYVYIPFFI